MIRVVVVDDSVTQREIFRRLLSSDGEFIVVAEARNGREALELVQRHAPDVVLMDIHMPDMDGIAATRAIMRQCPVSIVVASATLRRRDVDLAMEAYQAGAVSVIEKPEGAVLLHLPKIAPRLRAELIAASKARPRRLAPMPPATDEANGAPPGLETRRVNVAGICASTGGPPVLVEILTALPKPFPLPILLVQHMSRGFEEGFGQWLSRSTGHPVALAEPGQRLQPGVWLAPGGRHLTLADPWRLALPEGAASEIHCPSGDPLFRSLAECFGARAAGVVLTGMGADGAEGLLVLKNAGGLTLIQDEASSPIWGMPRSAKECNAALYVCNPRQIATALSQMAGVESSIRA